MTPRKGGHSDFHNIGGGGPFSRTGHTNYEGGVIVGARSAPRKFLEVFTTQTVKISKIWRAKRARKSGEVITLGGSFAHLSKTMKPLDEGGHSLRGVIVIGGGSFSASQNYDP